MDSMYRVMNRINEIKKRFGLMRHNAEGMGKKRGRDFKSGYTDLIKGADKNSRKGVSGGSKNLESINLLADYYAKKNGIPTSLVKAIIETESGYNVKAESRKGAKGLMQLMPSVMKDMNIKNPYFPSENIRGGVEHLKRLLDYYKGDYNKALAAYNAGRGAVDRHKGVPDYKETKEFVKKVLDAYSKNR